MTPITRRPRAPGVLFFLPAILQPRSRRNSGADLSSSAIRTPIPEKRDDLESAGLVAPGLGLGLGVASSSRRSSDARSRSRPATPEPVAPPPYRGSASAGLETPSGSGRWSAAGGGEWAPWSPAVDR
ncbi:hypothetical protein BDV93DRAFT_521701, partial [Ceratobasidium sp. AG-I]